MDAVRHKKRIGCKSGEGFEILGVRFVITLAPGKGQQFLVEVDGPDDAPVKRIKRDAIDRSERQAT